MAQLPSPKDMTAVTPIGGFVKDAENSLAASDDVVESGPAISPPRDSDGWHSFSGNDNENRYLRLRCSATLAVFNAQNLTISAEERATAWHKLIEPFHNIAGGTAAPLVKSPFYVDYGNVDIAPSAYVHRNVYISDNPDRQAPVKIGHGAFIGPGVQILSVQHEVDWRKRDGVMGPALARRTTIEDNVFVGAGACIMPGVTIEERAVVGAGAVVTKSVPASHVAIGDPARATRKVTLDVFDAPGLWYELREEKMMVLNDCSPPPKLPSRSRTALGFPACESRSETALKVHRGSKDFEPAESACSDTERIQPSLTEHAEQVQWVSPPAEPEDRRTRGEVDVALFLMAVGVAGCIVHAVLH
ncbi:hypothetical protein LTR78_002788 [Recurvomyces mirabilis]|uniref:Mannose-1-phosphate guanylyltransferase n=2 Tax=Recurvomyces mirabilis TaxID=574656 RepID=A0AAE0WSG5_9PEZI|nr:hypothetical protein LTR78_002788 [Recurvomyces mirabilis]